MITKTIFVLGPPASGKSTFIGYLVKEMKSAGCGADEIKIIKDTELLKAVCPKTAESSNYHYKGEKLIFSSSAREKIINQLLTAAAEETNKTQGKFLWCMVEFTHPNWQWALEKFFDKKLLAKSVLLFIYANRKLLLSRNQNRPTVSQVPEEYLRIFIDSQGKQTAGIKNRFCRSFRISNQSAKEKLKEKAKEILGQIV